MLTEIKKYSYEIKINPPQNYELFILLKKIAQIENINIPTVTLTTDWFDTLAKDNFENVILPLFKDKSINYLEIGSFEGASMHYLFENVFTNQNIRAVVIDPFESSQTHYIPIERFKKNELSVNFFS